MHEKIHLKCILGLRAKYHSQARNTKGTRNGIAVIPFSLSFQVPGGEIWNTSHLMNERPEPFFWYSYDKRGQPAMLTEKLWVSSHTFIKKCRRIETLQKLVSLKQFSVRWKTVKSDAESENKWDISLWNRIGTITIRTIPKFRSELF